MDVISPAREYTYQEVADILGISARTVIRRVNAGLIQRTQIGDREVITQKNISDYEAAVESGKVTGWEVAR